MGAVTAAGEVNGKTIFQRNVLPHIVTTVLAYAWNVAAVVIHALCVSLMFDAVHGVTAVSRPGRQRARTWRIAGRLAAGAAALGALVAAAYKIQQHLH